MHAAASAFRADVDIEVPDCFQKFCHGSIYIFRFETLVPLKFKYQFQVSGFIPVIQKTIVSDLLETGWQHMHQVTPDEFHIRQSDRPVWSAGSSVSGRKRHLILIYGQKTAV